MQANVRFAMELLGRTATLGRMSTRRHSQLWMKHAQGVVGVSDDPVGVTYWKVANGIRLTGMPAFDHTLSETERWQVSLLMAGADKPQTPEVKAVLRQSVAAFAHPERDNRGAGAAK